MKNFVLKHERRNALPHFAKSVKTDLYQMRICLRTRLMASEGEVKRIDAGVPSGMVSFPKWLSGSMDVNVFFNFPFKILTTQ